MPNKPVKILSLEYLTQNIIKIRAERPEKLNYAPGQAVHISINEPEWCERKNAFSLTSIPRDEYIEFVIRISSDTNNFLAKLTTLKLGDELIVHESFAGLPYKGEGIFIAGGVGVAPFMSRLKELKLNNKLANNKLIFANRTSDDIFSLDYFTELLGDNFINILSEEKHEMFHHGLLNADFLKEYTVNTSQYYYICGSLPMVNFVSEQLTSLGVNEEFILKEGY